MLNKDEYAQLSKEEREVYDASSPEEAEAFAAAWRDVGRSGSGSSKDTSTMLTVGRAGTLVSLAIGALLLLVDMNAEGLASSWAVLLLSASGAFITAWMLGAIEMRLIEINETLKSQRR